jgi:hypothetical protein
MDRADALRLLQAMTDVLGDGDEARILIAAFFRLEKIIQATDPDAHLMLWMLLAIAHTAGTKTVFDATDALRHADQALIGHAGGNKSAITRRNKQAEEWADHRRQTDQMRNLHRAETQSHRDNEGVAVARHAQEIRRIDDIERESLDALNARRGSLIGRSVALVRGSSHYDRKAETITEHCETLRMSKHRDLEALKERQFAAAQQARLRQAHERKGIFEFHRLERQQLSQAHDRGREAQVNAYERAFTRAAQREERKHEHARHPNRGRSR